MTKKELIEKEKNNLETLTIEIQTMNETLKTLNG